MVALPRTDTTGVPEQRCIIYARVSTAGQEADGTSLETQQAACTAYAAANGYRVVDTMREVYSGASLWERPRLTAVRDRLRRGEADILLCYALDRLSRKQAHLAIVADECERAGVELRFVTEEFEKSAVGEFIRSAKSFAAEVEREKIQERTQRGLRERVNQGKPIGGGRVPYGYRWRDADKSGYEPDERTAPIVRRMFALAAEGRPIRAIATAFNEEGVQTPNGGGFWRAGVVLEMLRRPIYAGRPAVYRWRRRQVAGREKPHMTKRPTEEQVQLPADVAPALVPADMFDYVQDRLDRNRIEATRRSADPTGFLLRTGFVFCGYCGRRAIATKHLITRGPRKGGYRKVYGVQGNCDTHRACGVTLFTGAEELDRTVWQHVRAILTQPAIIEAEVARLAAADTAAVDLATTDRALAAVQRQQANVAAAIATLDDPLTHAPLLAQLRGLGAQQKALEAEREAVVRRETTAAATRDRLTTLAAWCQTVAANLDALSYDERRLALKALGTRVELFRADHDPHYKVHFAIPLDVAPPTDGADTDGGAGAGGPGDSVSESLSRLRPDLVGGGPWVVGGERCASRSAYDPQSTINGPRPTAHGPLTQGAPCRGR